MKAGIPEATILVRLPRPLIEALLSLHSSLSDDVALALVRGKTRLQISSPETADCPKPAISCVANDAYKAEFLGALVEARTLPEIFATIIDMTEGIAPEVLTALADVRTRERRYIARKREDVHLSSPHLPTMKSTSGWWISKCISKDDLTRALREFCRLSGLTFGKDLKFPA